MFGCQITVQNWRLNKFISFHFVNRAIPSKQNWIGTGIEFFLAWKCTDFFAFIIWGWADKLRPVVADLWDAILKINKKIVVSSFICVFYNIRWCISRNESSTGRHHLLGVVPKGNACPLYMADLAWSEGRLHDVLEVVDAVVCDSVWICLDDDPHPKVAPV